MSPHPGFPHAIAQGHATDGDPGEGGLTPLARIDGLDAPCRRHPSEAELCGALAPDAGAGFAAMASRAFPESDLNTVVLFGQWLAWIACFDDQRDDGELASDPAGLDHVYAALLAVCAEQASSAPARDLRDHQTPAAPRDDHRDHQKPAAPPRDHRALAALLRVDRVYGDEPLIAQFTALWHATAPRVSHDWRHRFRCELRRHWYGSRAEAANRRTRIVPRPADYVRLRRITNGALLFLLPEAMLRVEVPWRVSHTIAWRELLDACNDVTAWCNDLASLAKEGNDVHNYVTVLAHALGAPPETAARRVCERIALRMAGMRAAAQALPSTFDDAKLSRRTACDVSRVAVTLLGAPRGHLEWLQESARYRIKTA